MKLFSWTDDVQSKNPESEFIKPMVLIKVSTFASPEAAAQSAASQMKDGDVMFLRHFGEAASGLPNLASESLADFLIGNTPSMIAWRNYSERFWAAYSAAGGVQPYRVVLENESGYTWYRIGVDNPTRLAQIDAAIATKKFDRKLLATYDKDVLLTSYGAASGGARWIMNFSRWAQLRYTKSLYEIISKPYYAQNYVGNVFSNYGVSKMYRDHTEINNWVSTKYTGVSYFGYNSPPIYPDCSGARGISLRSYQAKVILDKNAADIDLARASRVGFEIALDLADSLSVSTKKLPWIALPRYRGNGMPSYNTYQPFEALVSALCIGGYKEALYWASPHETQADRDAVEDILARVNIKYANGLIKSSINTGAKQYPQYDNAVNIDEIDFS
jgi:hypothetical protein